MLSSGVVVPARQDCVHDGAGAVRGGDQGVVRDRVRGADACPGRRVKLDTPRPHLAVGLDDAALLEVDVQLDISAARTRQAARHVGHGAEHVAPARKQQPAAIETQRSAESPRVAQVAHQTQRDARRAAQPLRQKDQPVGAPLGSITTQRGAPDLQGEGICRAAGIRQAQRSALDIDATAAPALQNPRALEVRGAVIGARQVRGARADALEINVGRDERDAACFELTAAQRAPGIEADDELRRSEQHAGASGLTQLDTAEDGFGAVPTPAQAELVEAYVEAGVGADQVFERGAMLRHTGNRQLIRQQHRGK